LLLLLFLLLLLLLLAGSSWHLAGRVGQTSLVYYVLYNQITYDVSSSLAVTGRGPREEGPIRRNAVFAVAHAHSASSDLQLRTKNGRANLEWLLWLHLYTAPQYLHGCAGTAGTTGTAWAAPSGAYKERRLSLGCDVFPAEIVRTAHYVRVTY
jgi:hypothetical protein